MLSFFEGLTDPRVERTKLHSLRDIIGLTICAVLSGCHDWEEIALYGEQKQAWLKQFLAFDNGIPSHDTINRVFAALDPKELQACFLDWVQNLAGISGGRIVSIDGKRLCNAGVQGKKAIVHMVSAWSQENSLVLGQVKTEDKSNEITAIPTLLELLVLQGAIVTIDAMGCQSAIAEKIIDQGADYVLSVKENQGHLLDDLQEAFAQTPAAAQHTTLEKGHGRIEKRTCRVITDTDWVCKSKGWKNLSSLISIETKRTIVETGEVQEQQRFYIASLTATAERFNHIIALDRENLANLKAMRPEGARAQLSLMLDHVQGREGQPVADPYYGDDSHFDETWRDVTEGARGLARRLQAEQRE